MRLISLGLLLGSLSLVPQQRGINQRPQQFDPGPLELVISGPIYDYPDRLQPRARKFTTKLINHSGLPIVIGPNATGVSYASIDFLTVTDGNGKALSPRTPGYYRPVGSSQGVRNIRLTDKDLIVLRPRETKEWDFDLTQFFLFPEPGAYRVQYTFSYSPPRLKEISLHDGTKLAPDFDVSRMSAAKHRMFQNSFGFSLKSNLWILTIRAL